MSAKRISIPATVFPDGAEPYDITITSRDIAHWERTHKGRSFGQFESDMRMEFLVELAYVASVRSGLWSGPENEFRDSVDVGMEPETADDHEDPETDPTNPDQ